LIETDCQSELIIGDVIPNRIINGIIVLSQRKKNLGKFKKNAIEFPLWELLITFDKKVLLAYNFKEDITRILGKTY
jgi:hypothetical protein